MSADVLAVDADTPVAKVAALLEEHNFRRVPVLERGRLVGVVSRSDLVQALTRAAEEPGDQAIRATLLAEREGQAWAQADSGVIVSGSDRRAGGRTPARPGVQVRRAAARGHSKQGWMESWYSFAFGAYDDPAHTGWGPLYALNERRVQPAGGSATYGLRDVEIVNYVVAGAMQHEDSLGEKGILWPGDVQCVSAGSGVRFDERNADPAQPAAFLQIWLEPQQLGLPASCQRATFPAEAKRGRLQPVASPDGRAGSLMLRQDAVLYAGLFDGEERARLDLAPGRLAYLHVARGSLRVNGETLAAGDGLAASGVPLVLESGVDAELLVFDLPGAKERRVEERHA
jgi:redox-sensitive bicupin YhaK (pirin superfamily)